jgi:hypothetical protein
VKLEKKITVAENVELSYKQNLHLMEEVAQPLDLILGQAYKRLIIKKHR